MLNQMKYDVVDLSWDTNFFEVKSAKINLNNQISESELEEIKNKIQGYEFITINNMNNNSFNNILIGKLTNAFLTDINIQFEKNDFFKKYKKDKNIFISNNFEVNEKIQSISKKSFIYSRFYNDNMLKKSDEIYSEWTKNSFNKKDKFFCVYKEHEILGYSIFSIKDECLTIELIAIDNNDKSKGIGTSLLQQVENYALENNIKKIKVGTQLDNIKAQNFYIKNGFKHCAVNSIYHWWPKKSEVR